MEELLGTMTHFVYGEMEAIKSLSIQQQGML